MKKRLLVLSGMFLCAFAVIAQQKVELDKRAARHYTAEEIANMDEIKIKQLNFIYTKSFYIDNSSEECEDCPECKELKAEDVDIYVYRAARQPNKRHKVAFTKDELYLDEKAMMHIRKKDEPTKPTKEAFNPCKNIVLLSQEELDYELSKIK